jgi:threonine dehydrogenase-like Zn-dependent dehydrogenase
VRAAVFGGNGVLRLEERTEPRISRDDEVLLEVEACGICGTDLRILDVPPGHPAEPGVVLGHEFVGIVRETGPQVRGVRPGDRVAVVTDIPCGACSACHRGRASQCERLRSLGVFEDGGLAPLAVVPAAACHPVDAELPPEIAALAEPIACVASALRRCELPLGGSVAILGAGPIGLIFTGLLRATGAGRVVVVEPMARRGDAALALGADRVVDPRTVDPVGAVLEATAGRGADLVVDAVGNQLPTALAAAAPAGRVVLFGMDEQARAEVSQFDITRRELTVLGAFASPDAFATAVDVLDRGLVDWRPLVSHVLPLEEIQRGIDLLRAGEAVKVVMDVRGAT